MKRIISTLITLGFAACGALEAATVDTMLAEGSLTTAFEHPSRGICLGALGFVDRTANRTKDYEIARTAALTELGGFLDGTRVSSTTKSRIEVSDQKVFESFLSESRTDVKAFLRGAEFPKSGVHNGLVYVYAEVCQKNAQIRSDLKEGLRDNTVEAVGVGTLSHGREKARRLALDDALRNAVAQYSGVTSTSESTVRNASDLQSRQATRSAGAVTHYKIIKETVLGDTIRVEILAEVGEAKASSRDMNKVIREHMGRPSIYLDVRDPEARQALRAMLSAADYEITNDQKQARYVLHADTETEESVTLGDMIGRKTSLTITLKDRMSADEAIVIRNNPSESLEVSDSESLRAQRSMQYAVESIRDRLVDRLTSKVNDQFVNGSKVLVSFSNFGRMREVENLKRLIESFPLTKQVTVRPVDGGVAYLDVLYLGDPNEIQSMTLKGAPDFRLNGLKAKNRSRNGLDFTF